MSNEDAPQSSEPRNWTEWREDVHLTLEELDRALAQARQSIYRLRPMVRPKNGEREERDERRERPTQFQGRRRERQ